jgi:hypothetical protein
VLRGAGMGIGDAVELVEVLELEEPIPLSGAWGRVLLPLVVVVWMEMLGRRVLGLGLEEDAGGREDDEEDVVRSPTTEDPLVDGV